MDEQKKREIWSKASKIDGLDSDMFRADACGAIISWTQFGQDSPFGWVVDHIYPQSKGGDDALLNLRPMNIANNRSKSNDYPVYMSAVTRGATGNEPHVKQFRVNAKLQLQLSQLYHISDAIPQ